jgi:mono/diheme cytochrome c family protein
LIGEPDANSPGMFGLYLVDRFGNKELLHRDPEISSLWPLPLAPRARPPYLPSQLAKGSAAEGTFVLQDVGRSWPFDDDDGVGMPRKTKVARLRIVQVLPKATWHANEPTVGLPHASCGKQVLGTVPVETDGSASFRAPSGVPLLFQTIDEDGAALQTMRSLTYLQPGETAACIGCHEPRASSPPVGSQPLALRRAPSTIEPGPEGSNPLSYPILVQPVLDCHCTGCHGGKEPANGTDLGGAPRGRYTASYEALAPLVAYADWAGRPGDFRVVNSEPVTRPGFFGARASPLRRLLKAGHHGVQLREGDWVRLDTWMDANALFYGTFDVGDQARQLRGEVIAGPGLE